MCMSSMSKSISVVFTLEKSNTNEAKMKQQWKKITIREITKILKKRLLCLKSHLMNYK